MLLLFLQCPALTGIPKTEKPKNPGVLMLMLRSCVVTSKSPEIAIVDRAHQPDLAMALIGARGPLPGISGNKGCVLK